MSKGTKPRAVRIEDGLWEAAKAKAVDNDTNLSAIIRQALINYINEGSEDAQ